MSNETMEQEDKEIAELKDQIEAAVESNKEKAALEPSPEPEPTTEAETIVAQKSPEPEPVKEKQETGKDDPMEWASKKGFKTPEDMARALLQKEQEFHQSRQKPTPPPQWQPAPDMRPMYPTYPQQNWQPLPGYPPPPVNDINGLAAMYPNVDPEDLKRFLPVVIDAARAISAQDRMAMEQRFGYIERTTQRNNELMTLMQDPAFRDSRVQKEVHQILDSDPSIFQRERAPLVYAYEKAMVNMARKQLQQGVSEERTTRPPVTAGGGNGSANTSPSRPTEREIEKWNPEEIKAYITSNGKVVPKR